MLPQKLWILWRASPDDSFFQIMHDSDGKIPGVLQALFHERQEVPQCSFLKSFKGNLNGVMHLGSVNTYTFKPSTC